METNITIRLPLLIILLTGLLVSEFFKHFKLPFASAVILIVSILGPYGFGYVHHNKINTFFLRFPQKTGEILSKFSDADCARFYHTKIVYTTMR